MIQKILKFGIADGLGTVTNLILFFIFADKFGLHPLGVSVFCFLVCATQNYCLNQLWTFKIENEEMHLSLKRWLKFILSSLIGFAINISVLKLLLGMYNWQYKVFPQGIGILCGMIFNFTASLLFVFRRKK